MNLIVQCELCGADTDNDGTKRCNRCWELETRIQHNPELAFKILQPIPGMKETLFNQCRELVTAAKLHIPRLGPADIQILKLTERSKINAEGWSTVSKMLWPLVSALPASLLERQQDADGGGKIKLTHVGQIIVDISTL